MLHMRDVEVTRNGNENASNPADIDFNWIHFGQVIVDGNLAGELVLSVPISKWALAKSLLITPNQTGPYCVWVIKADWKEFHLQQQQIRSQMEGWPISIRLWYPFSKISILKAHNKRAPIIFFPGFNEVNVPHWLTISIGQIQLFVWALQLLFVYIIEIKSMSERCSFVGFLYLFSSNLLSLFLFCWWFCFDAIKNWRAENRVGQTTKKQLRLSQIQWTSASWHLHNGHNFFRLVIVCVCVCWRVFVHCYY